MGKAAQPSVVRWSELYPWLGDLADKGVQPRVVLMFNDTAHLRVVVTCRKRDANGVWVEVLRLGEVVNTVHPDAPIKAAIRVCAQLLNEIGISESEGIPPPSYVVQLPLPGL